MAGSNAGTMYGRALYFAERVSKADEYTTPSEDDLRPVLLCRVTLGNVLCADARSGVRWRRQARTTAESDSRGAARGLYSIYYVDVPWLRDFHA